MIFKKNNQTTSLTEIYPVISFENSQVLMANDGAVAMNFKFTGPEEGLWDASDFDRAHTTLVNLVSELPENAVLQKTDIYFNRISSTEIGEDKFFERKRKEHIFGKSILLQESYLSVILYPEKLKHKKIQNSLVANSGKAALKSKGLLSYLKTSNLLGEQLALLPEQRKLAEKVELAFSQIDDVSLSLLDDEENRALVKRFLNTDFDPKNQKDTYINSIDNSFAGKLSIGGHNVSVISTRNQAEDVNTCFKVAINDGAEITNMIGPLTNYLGRPHVLVQTYQRYNSKEQIGRIINRAKIAAVTSKEGNEEAAFLMQDSREISTEVKRDNKALIKFGLSVVLIEKDAEEMEKAKNKTLDHFSKVQGMRGFVETFDNLPLYLASIPGCGFDNYRTLCMPADVSACYMNWITSYKSDKTGIIFKDRNQHPIYIDLFSDALNNKNNMIIAPSGGGKSYLAGYIITQRFENDDIQIIIDNGGTYKNLMTTLGGTYFEYDIDNPVAFNPFIIERRGLNNRLDLDKKEFLSSLIFLIWKGDLKKNPPTKAEKAVLDKWLRKYYDQLKDIEVPSLDGFIGWLVAYNDKMLARAIPASLDPISDAETIARENRNYDQHELDVKRTFDLNDFFTVMQTFTKGGDLDFLFNGTKALDFSGSNLLCFDMKNVKGNAQLYPIVTQIIIELVLDKIRTHKDTRKHIYMEEAWSMLADTMGSFVETMYRTIRKENGSITVITQHVVELMNEFGAGIKNNAETYFLPINGNKESREQVGKFLGLTRSQSEKYGTLGKTKTGRELLVVQGSKSIVVEVDASPEEHTVITSHPTERENFNRLREEYYMDSMSELEISKNAINQFIEDNKIKS